MSLALMVSAPLAVKGHVMMLCTKHTKGDLPICLTSLVLGRGMRLPLQVQYPLTSQRIRIPPEARTIHIEPAARLGGLLRRSSLVLAFNFCCALLLGQAASAQTYAITDLGTLGGSYSQGAAINATGQVTALSLIGGDAAYHAFLYSGCPPNSSIP